MKNLISNLAFKPPRPVRGKLQTVTTFTLAGVVEVRGLTVEDDKAAACFLWPSVQTRGGCRVKTVKLCDVAQRDAVEQAILTEYRYRRASGELPGETFPLPLADTMEGSFSIKGYLDGLRRGQGVYDEFDRLHAHAQLRICLAILHVTGVETRPIRTRDAELIGMLERHYHNHAWDARRKRGERAGRRTIGGAR